MITTPTPSEKPGQAPTELNERCDVLAKQAAG
jgi:hypothetical protein